MKRDKSFDTLFANAERAVEPPQKEILAGIGQDVASWIAVADVAKFDSLAKALAQWKRRKIQAKKVDEVRECLKGLSKMFRKGMPSRKWVRGKWKELGTHDGKICVRDVVASLKKHHGITATETTRRTIRRCAKELGIVLISSPGRPKNNPDKIR